MIRRPKSGQRCCLLQNSQPCSATTLIDLRLQLVFPKRKVRRAWFHIFSEAQDGHCEANEMLRLASSVCPFCEVRAIFKQIAPSWQPFRAAATLQKRKPSRMTLARDVKPGPRDATATKAVGRSPFQRKRNSPFGGMNITAVPESLRPKKYAASQPEQRRVSRGRDSPKKSKDDKRTKDPMHASTLR